MPRAAEAPLRLRDAVALGLLHGPAELLPISSSGHVVLVPWLRRWPYGDLDAELRKSFEVALHAAAAAALLVGLRHEVGDAIRALERKDLALLTGSTLPPAVVGVAFERSIARLGTPAGVAAGLVAGSLAMAVADARGSTARHRADAGVADGVALGVAQACALVPGISRNGATLAAARARGFARSDASILSWGAALPVILGATALKGTRIARGGLPPGAGRGFAAGIVASFLSTLASVRVLRTVGRDRSLAPFAAYRIGLAALVLRRLRSRP